MSVAEPVPAPADLATLALVRRTTNYLAAAQVYLRDNALLTEALRPEHIKCRLLGHWGTCPGINLVYAHLNRLVKSTGQRVLLVTGPGHGAAANLANLWLEGTLGEVYPQFTRDAAGASRLVRSFSWPGGFPSHLNPGTPGVIHEGGELGYALATSFGAAFDRPDLLVACIVGDGEAETGPTACGWNGNRFLDPRTSGAVLPILHVNGYKIASSTIFGDTDDEEITSFFRGLGWDPLFVGDGTDSFDYDGVTAGALDEAHAAIGAIQRRARSGEDVLRPRWPVIVLRSPKGWTGPAKDEKGRAVVGSWRAHQVPLEAPAKDPEELRILEAWLRSYKPEELFDDRGAPRAEVVASIPAGDLRLGRCPEANGGAIYRPLDLPPMSEHFVETPGRGADVASANEQMGGYLREVIRRNPETFRIFCPDELASNRLGKTLDASPRGFVWPIAANDEHVAYDGRILETLSEHNCEGWLEGYVLTGRHGLFPCYEAFLPIVDGMVNQYGKFLKSAAEVPWRKPVASLNLLLTSEGWRQDHNGYSHQGPGFLNTLLNRKKTVIRVYLPPDANTLISTIDHCLRSRGYINAIASNKYPQPVWLTPDEAVAHCTKGVGEWRWAGTAGDAAPDVVLASAGAIPTMETLAAAWLLKRDLPELKTRVVNVTDLLSIATPNMHPHGIPHPEFEALFGTVTPVVFAFHGYPSALKEILFDRWNPLRFHIRGYEEEGTTTTPFSLLVQNRISRWDLLLEALKRVPRLEKTSAPLAALYRQKIEEHRAYAEENGDDPPEIKDWRWTS
jgi:xylulose-5-phosphate/fructose-6-phosphate phosphoketolase